MPENRESADKQDQTQRARPTIPFSYQTPPDESDYGTKDDYDSCREWTRLIVEFFALLFLIWYANSASIQAVANQDAAVAAKRSADAQIAASRAWIVPTGKTKTWEAQATNGPKYMGIDIDWMNAGKTPAIGLHGTAEYSVKPFVNRKSCLALKEQAKWTSEMPLLLQGQQYTITFQNYPPEWNETNKGGLLFIHGCVWYTDVLANRERTTEFYYEASAILAVVMPYPGAPSFNSFIFQ